MRSPTSDAIILTRSGRVKGQALDPSSLAISKPYISDFFK